MDRSILTVSSNNAISPNCLKLVKASSDDRDARTITSRMGMTVPEFMDVLGYSSSTTDQNNCNSSSLVWPKHTELEVRDPWSAVYQYEPTDISWCIRFKALGCYNFVPPPFTNRSYKVPETPIPAPDVNKNLTKVDQVSPNSRTFQTLQRIRSSADKDKSSLPSETITLAERHKLWEDLLLSDSEEENEEKPRLSSLKTSSKLITLETPVDDGDISSKPDDQNTLKSFPILNHAIRPPPPFVSPLSILNGDCSVAESPIPVTENGPVEFSRISVANQQGSFDPKVSVQHIPDVPTESVISKSEKSMCLSASQSPSTTTANPSRRHLTDDLTVSIPTNVPSDYNDFTSKSTTVTSITTPKLTVMPKPVSVLSGKFNSNHDSVIKPRTDPITNTADEYCSEHYKRPEANKNFIQRLLLESGQFLTQKDCLITELSPIHHNESVSISTKPSQPEREKSVFTEQKSENATNSLITNRTPSDDSNLKSDCKPSHECTRSDNKNITPQKSKIIDHQSSFQASCRKDAEKADARIENKTSKLNSTFFSQEGLKESPTNRDSLSSFSGLNDEYVSPIANVNTGSVKPKDKLEKVLNLSNNITSTERKTSTNDIQSVVVNMDVSHTDMNSFNSMPPPTHDSTGKKLKRRSKCSSKLKISKESFTASSSELSSLTHEQPQNDSDMKNDIDGSICLVQDTEDIYPLRDVPSDRWIFSDLTVTKVRNKIQQSFSLAKNEEVPVNLSSSDCHLIKKMRDILLSAVEDDSPIISKINQSRRNRPRSLMGILLVPPPSSFSVSSKTRVSPHLSEEPSSHKSYHDICTMTSPHLNQTTILNDADIQCDIWPSSNNNNLISSRFVSQSSSSIISTPTQKPLGTVPPILRDPVCDLTSLSSNITQNLPQLNGQSLPCINLSDSLLFIEEQFGRIIKQEDEKLQNSNASTEIFKAEECKLEASKCWKSLVSAVSSCSRDSSGEAPNRSQMLLNLQSLHEYPVQMTRSVKHYLAAAYIFESKNEILKAADMLTEAANQIQHCVRRMHRVEAKLTKRRSHRTEVENSPDLNELTVKVKRDASWMYLWYYVLMRIKAAVGFHTYRLRLQLIDTLREEIDANLSVVKQHIPSLTGSIGLPKVSDSPSSSKVSSIKSKVTSNSSSETDDLKILESLVAQFVRFNQLTSCVHSAMIEWQQADELVTKVPYLKSPVGRKSEGSTEVAGYTSFSGHLRPIHSVDIDIASASEGAYINTSQIPILVLLRYMDGIFHVHPLIIDQLKYPSGQESVQSISLKNNSLSEIRNSTSVSQEQKLPNSNPTLITDSTPLTGMALSTVSKTPNKQRQEPDNIAQSKFENTVANNINIHSEPPSSHGISERLLKKKSHNKHSSGVNPSPNLVASSVVKRFTPHHSNALDENCSDASIPSSKHDISNAPKRKSKRRRLLQCNESTDTLPLPIDASSTNTDTDLDSYGRSTTLGKCNESPGKKSNKSKTIHKLNNPESGCFGNQKPDCIDNSSSVERKLHVDDHLFSKKKSKRSHTHSKRSKLNCDVVSHPCRIIASDDQSPSTSPPPSRKFCRSRSVAPTAPKSSSHVSTLSNVPNLNCPVSVEDNTYQPKRIKPSHSKVHGRRISDSPDSDSFPTPTYKPSVPVDPPDAINRHNQRRRSRSVHLSSPRQKNASLEEVSNNANVSELSQDSIGYSPTKRSLINGGSSNISQANNLPVYRVSHISPSPPTKSQHKNGSSKSHNDLVRSKTSHHSNSKSQSSIVKSSSEVPSFYARWIKEPSNTDRYPTTSSNNYSNSKSINHSGSLYIERYSPSFKSKKC